MKPTVLKISAFGPYADEVVLDFREMEDQGIFLITGNTGAGKSTVFEAMYYALYGDIIQEDKKQKNLRSDFTKDLNRITFVDFSFRIKDKNYRIYRQPAQLVPYKQREGFKEQSALVELYEDEGKPALTNLIEVKDRISDIIGLTADQFKKIIMIPQGAFQDFLLAKTSEKRDILRHLFNTELYSKAQEIASVRAREIHASYQEEEKTFNILREQYPSESIIFDEVGGIARQLELLQKLFQDDMEKRNKDKKVLASLRQEIQETEGALKTIEKHNEGLTRWEAEEAKLKLLMEEKSAIETLEYLLGEAEKAKNISFQEERMLERKEDIKHAYQQFRDHERVYTNLKIEAAEIETNLEQLDGQVEEYENIANSFASRERRLTYLQSLKEKEEAIKLLEEGHAQKESDEKELRFSLEEKEKEIESLREKQEKDQLILEKREGLQEMFYKLDKERLALGVIHELSHEQVADKIAYQEVCHLGSLAKEDLEKAKLALEQGRQAEKDRILGSMAQQLKEGEPCPLCGSHEHPKLAQDFKNKRDSNLEELEKKWLSVNEIYQMRKNQALNYRDKLRQRSEKIEQADFICKWDMDWVPLTEKVSRLIAAKKQEQDQCAEQLSELQKLKKEVDSRQHMLRKYQDVLTEERKIHEQLVNGQQDFFIKQGVLKEEIAQLQKDLPEVLPELLTYQESLDHDKRKYEAFLRNKTAAEKELQKIAITVAQMESTCGVSKDYYEKNKDAFQSEGRIFLKALHESFLDYRAYSEAKKTIDNITIWRDRAQLWKHEKELREESIRIYQNTYHSRERIDVTELTKKYLQMKERETQSFTAYTRLEKELEDNEKILARMQEIVAKAKSLEKDYELAERCRKIMSGDNPLRMDMETYVLTYYFEAVLRTANKRFYKMTSGRFSFQRQKSIEDKRRSAGLELEVMDVHTGRARSVSTLSGGERFKASLALALGLADVVTEESGGIELSTMFIDEGFGSLDEDSLDQTIDTLISLQKHGRLIGIISHVADLKERIPAQLIVEASDTGSNAYFSVVKNA